MIFVGAFQIAVAVALAAAQARWYAADDGSRGRSGASGRHHWYLRATGTWPDVEGGLGAAATQFVRFVVLLNALIPISLYVTLELVKVIQCGWISLDRELHDRDAGVSCGVRTTTLNEELDKFGACCRTRRERSERHGVREVFRRRNRVPRRRRRRLVRRLVFARHDPPRHHRRRRPRKEEGCRFGADSGADSRRFGRLPSRAPPTRRRCTLCQPSRPRAARDRGDPRVEAFLSHLATCHTVTPAEDAERRGGGVTGVLYQAASPDEERWSPAPRSWVEDSCATSLGVAAVRRDAEAETEGETGTAPEAVSSETRRRIGTRCWP